MDETNSKKITIYVPISTKTKLYTISDRTRCSLGDIVRASVEGMVTDHLNDLREIARAITQKDEDTGLTKLDVLIPNNLISTLESISAETGQGVMAIIRECINAMLLYCYDKINTIKCTCGECPIWQRNAPSTAKKLFCPIMSKSRLKYEGACIVHRILEIDGR